MALEVIGTGFGRTGTLSMKHALQQLGFGRCYHMEEAMKRPQHGKAWHRAAFGQPLDTDLVFDGFRSAVDWPASAVWRDLIARYPDAKVVHTHRDPERWWQSTNDTIFRTGDALAPWVKKLVPHAGRMFEMTDRLIWEGIFDGRFADKTHAIAVFEQHTADVVATVPADRLLLFEAKEGWEPLCAFLGVTVPTGDYPRVNDTEAMLKRIRAMRAVSVGGPIVAGSAAAGVAMAAVKRSRGSAEPSS